MSSAYFLQKEGHEVTVLDKTNIDSGASFVNAGYLTPSHIVPLAAPGMISKGDQIYVQFFQSLLHETQIRS